MFGVDKLRRSPSGSCRDGVSMKTYLDYRLAVLLMVAGTITGCERKGETTSSSGTSSAENRDSNRGVAGQSQAPVTRSPATPTVNRTPTDQTVPNQTVPDKTPMDQSESPAQIAITSEIRKAIIADKAMSMNAQNCKIITEKSGVVTLRGKVDSQAEKDAVEAKAKAVAGVTRVDNQLEIKTN